jgi:hypothetical protein
MITTTEIRPCDSITLEVTLPFAFGLRYRVGLALLKIALFVFPFHVELNEIDESHLKS